MHVNPNREPHALHADGAGVELNAAKMGVAQGQPDVNDIGTE